MNQAQNISLEDFVFADEAGLSTKMTRAFARASAGDRVYGHVPGSWGENLSIIGAMTMKGPSAFMSIPGAVDGDVFNAYVEKILVPTLRPGNVVVMDNLSVHKVAGVREAIERVGAHLLFLPPYHPDLNPIEKLWSKLKTIMRTIQARTMDELQRALSVALEQILSRDSCAWIKSCGY